MLSVLYLTFLSACLCECLRESEILSESFQHSLEHWELVEVEVVNWICSVVPNYVN